MILVMTHTTLVALPPLLHDVKLWLVDLDTPLDDLAQSWLSPNEHARASRFVFRRDADRYRAAHVHLRQLLWQHCRWPALAEFAIGTHGKPRAECEFNLSHSDGHGLIGICESAQIGVDVEVLRVVDDV